MAKANSTSITRAPKDAKSAPESEDQARRAGALACMQALRDLEQASENTDIDDTAEAFFGKRINDATAFAAALGPMPPQLEGIIIAMAEYIHTSITTGEPNLDNWRPFAVMTEAERKAEIDEMNRAISADKKRIGAGSNEIKEGGAQ